MYIVMNRVMVNSDWHDEFVERFTRRKGQIDKVPGFVSMQVLKPEELGIPFVVFTSWIDKAAFQQWMKSDDFKLAHQNPMPKKAFAEGGGFETFEVVVSSDSKLG